MGIMAKQRLRVSIPISFGRFWARCLKKEEDLTAKLNSLKPFGGKHELQTFATYIFNNLNETNGNSFFKRYDSA